jgi:hypothetical protein
MSLLPTISERFPVRCNAAILCLGLALPAAAGAAQARTTSVYAVQQPRVERPASEAPAQTVVIQDLDARQTRQALEDILKRLPPAVGRVLRTDPSLLGNEAYLAPYPTLAAFLKQHPEVRTTPAFFFEHIGPVEFYSPMDRGSEAVRIWRDILQFFAIGGVFLIVTSALIWIIRTLVEYRRWHRTSKIHTEVHNKLMDRLTANEDLLAYMQSPSGQRFLESAPIALEAPARPVGAPLTRILWSVQAGIVLVAGAIGLLYVSTNVIEEVAQPFFVIGVLALAVGAGFVASAGASFLLSRRLGLFEPVLPPREHTEPSSR